jgi:hypothetical protein
MKTQAINIIFDGPPSHKSGRFVEVETDDGKSIGAGEWVEREDGLWALRITELPPENHMHVNKPESNRDDALREQMSEIRRGLKNELAAVLTRIVAALHDETRRHYGSHDEDPARDAACLALDSVADAIEQAMREMESE